MSFRGSGVVQRRSRWCQRELYEFVGVSRNSTRNQLDFAINAPMSLNMVVTLLSVKKWEGCLCYKISSGSNNVRRQCKKWAEIRSFLIYGSIIQYAVFSRLVV